MHGSSLLVIACTEAWFAIVDEASSNELYLTCYVLLAALSQIVEGKREKKMVQRLDFQVAKPAKVLKVENGKMEHPRTCLSPKAIDEHRELFQSFVDMRQNEACK